MVKREGDRLRGQRRRVVAVASEYENGGDDAVPLPKIRVRRPPRAPYLSFHKERIPPFTAGVNPTLADQSTDDTLAGYSTVIGIIK